MIKNSLSVKIGGEAGYGVNATGQIFSKACIRAGLWVFSYVEYPSLIRGGHNSYQIVIREKEVQGPRKSTDLLIALDSLTISTHLEELSKGAGIIYDPDEIDIDSLEIRRGDLNLYPLPLGQLTLSSGGQKLMTNMTALGAAVGLLDFDLLMLEEIIKEQFQSKDQEVLEANLKCARSGYQYSQNQFSDNFEWSLEPIEGERKMFLSGNEATALGSLAGGLDFFVAYPMTPATSILHYLAEKEEDTGIIVKQMEDEIAVINMGIGASFAGKRVMVATSGGGFSLMVEGLGLSAMTETPIVVVNSQRGGPSTGLPTWTEQSDLSFLLHAGHGDFPRVVFAPGDYKECFEIAALSLSLAAKYQLPVLILLDKFLSESFKSEPFFTSKTQIEKGKLVSESFLRRLKRYGRYEDTADGISPRSLPGQEGGEYIANSDEHDEYGYSTDNPEVRVKMMEKRFRKVKELAEEIKGLKIYGDKLADITLLGWGSTKGPGLESLELLRKRGAKARYLHLFCLDPLPVKELEKELARGRVILVEGNKTAQLGEVIRAKTGIEIKEKLLKFDGRPIYSEEIADWVLEKLNKAQLGYRAWF